MKSERLSALILAGALTVGLASCAPKEGSTAPDPTPTVTPEATATPTPELSPVDREELKVGFLYPGDISDAGYTRSHREGAEEMQNALSLTDEQIVAQYNVGTEVECAQAIDELTAAGCQIIFSTSAAFEGDVTTAARENPDVQFCQLAGTAGGELDNLHDYYAALYEGRYLSGIVAGLKAKELGNPRLGYVAPTACAQVISGYTAFYLGARSVWDEVTMDVIYTGSWTDTALESSTTKALVNRGCGVLGQYTSSTAAAAMAEQLGAFLVGYDRDLTSAAPGAALISTGVHWGVYYTQAVQALLDGTAIPDQWCKGLADDVVFLTPLNEDLAARDTIDTVAQAEKGIREGSLQVFAGPLTGVNADGETLSLAEGEHYAESDTANGGGSAPTFDYIVEGINVVSGN